MTFTEIAVSALQEVGHHPTVNGTGWSKAEEAPPPDAFLRAVNIGRTAVGLEPLTLAEAIACQRDSDELRRYLAMHGLDHLAAD
jgi:hypothetical protein